MSAFDNTYNGLSLTFTTGANAGQSRIIQSYVGSSRTFTFASAWTSTPAAGDSFYFSNYSVVTLDPTKPLAYSTAYKVVIQGGTSVPSGPLGVEDSLSGNPLANPNSGSQFVWYFITAAPPQNSALVTQSTVQSTPIPTTTSFAGGAQLSALDNSYSGLSLTFTTGSDAGQSRVVLSYTGSSRSFTLASALTSAPASGDAFYLSGTPILG